MEHKKW